MTTKAAAAIVLVVAMVLCFDSCVQAETTWGCYDNQNVAGWDVFPTRKPRYTIESTLADCKWMCSTTVDCTFIVWNKTNGMCFLKYSWKSGGDGRTEYDPYVIACQIHRG